jgi:hypothetical protein
LSILPPHTPYIFSPPLNSSYAPFSSWTPFLGFLLFPLPSGIACRLSSSPKGRWMDNPQHPGWPWGLCLLPPQKLCKPLNALIPMPCVGGIHNLRVDWEAKSSHGVTGARGSEMGQCHPFASWLQLSLWGGGRLSHISHSLFRSDILLLSCAGYSPAKNFCMVG